MSAWVGGRMGEGVVFYFVLRGNRLNWLGDGRERVRQLTVLTHRPTRTQTIA